jgi:hypothetical protein
MELVAVLKAKAGALIEPVELNPFGKVFPPDLAKALVARYNFQTIPQLGADNSKGLTFGMGHFGNILIEELTLYQFGIMLGTRTSTSESKRLLEDAISWAAKDVGLVLKPVRRWQYESQLIFESKVPLTKLHPAAQVVADVMGKHALEVVGTELKYEMTAVMWEFDQLERKYSLGRFSIQRRDNTPFSENKYFSDAPLPTDVHLKTLQQFEAAVGK